MSDRRRTDSERDRDREGVVLTMWQPLPGDGAPDAALCARCDLPLGSRSYELTVGGVDRAGGLGVAPHRWTIRTESLCTRCYTGYLEAQLATPRGRGKRRGWDWDD